MVGNGGKQPPFFYYCTAWERRPQGILREKWRDAIAFCGRAALGLYPSKITA